MHLKTATIILLASLGGGPAMAVDLYVARNGSDAAPGTLKQPFATLERARDEVRRLKAAGPLQGGATVHVRAGFYCLQQPFALGAEDAGTKDAPITYRAYGKEKVLLVGGREITGFKPYKGEILQCDVSALGLEKLTQASPNRFHGDVPAFELFFDGRRMDLARWPNHVPDHPRDGEWTYVASVPEKGSRTRFCYYTDRPKAWAHPEEAQVHIWPWHDWFDQYVGIKSIDAEKREIALAANTSYDLQPGRRFFVRNVFEELDAPGEWYLDRRAGTLYFWPPKPLAQGNVFVSLLDSVVTLKDTQFVTVRGFTIECCRGTAVRISGGTGNRVAACEIRNTFAGAVAIDGGTENGAVGNDIHDTGRTGITLSGGDRKTLTPCNHYADNNHIWLFGRVLKTTMSAIEMTGVGTRVSHNLIHDGPAIAIMQGGNDHVVEYNDIHHVCTEVSDNGIWYSGRNWTYRGNVLRYNKLHDVLGYGFDRVDQKQGVIQYSSLKAAQGFYLDDAVSSFHIHGNVLYRIADMMIQLGGGRDNLIENNIFVDGRPAIGVDARWEAYPWDACNRTTIKEMPIFTPPWSTRYPALAKPMRHDSWPEGNRFLRNISAAVTPHPEGFVAFRYAIPADATEAERNLVWNPGGDCFVQARFLDKKSGGKLPWAEWQQQGFDRESLVADPRFVDPAKDNYQLRDDSPAYKLGFEKIPMEKIGLYADELRASWPPPKDTRRLTLERTVDTFPIPGWTPPDAPKAALFTVPRAAIVPGIDGEIITEEWGGADAARAMVLEQELDGSVTGPRSWAWLQRDDQYLYLAVRSEVNPGRPLKTGATWGQDDSVEVALRGGTPPKPGGSKVQALLFVLRGYPKGQFESSTEAGAPADAAGKLQAAVRYAARVVDAGHWCAEWRIPFAALGIDPTKQARIPFNITVRKTAGGQWCMWRGTIDKATWSVDDAGEIVLEK